MAIYDGSDFISQRPPAMLSISAYKAVDFVEQRFLDLRSFFVRHRTERALSKLSNRQLSDIGIHRSEIAEFSARAAHRRG